MLLGRPSGVRANYVCFKLRKGTHTLWIGMKRSLDLKIDGALACRLLTTTITGLNRRNSIEVNDVRISDIIGF